MTQAVYDLSTTEGRVSALAQAHALLAAGADLTAQGDALLTQAIRATEAALKEGLGHVIDKDGDVWLEVAPDAFRCIGGSTLLQPEDAEDYRIEPIPLDVVLRRWGVSPE